MSELVFGKDVKLRPQTIDRDGRLVARVFVDNQDAGLELLKQGLCWVYEKYMPQATIEVEASYRAAQATGNPISSVFGKTPIQYLRGSGAKSNV